MDTPPPHILARKQSERALEQSSTPESEGPDLWATLDETPPGVPMQSARVFPVGLSERVFSCLKCLLTSSAE